jgi:peptidoglycan hydrolase-like protein with peptidoglycan-binding domain
MSSFAVPANRIVTAALPVAHKMMVKSMKPIAMVAGALLLASTYTAAAQTPTLAYVQPVSPAAVQAVQQSLRSAGSYSGGVDGVWGPDSEAALQQFQTNHQLQVTGQLNQATASALGLDLGALLGTQQAALPASMPPAESLRPSSVRLVQERLHSLGFYAGPVDGVWGQSTENAVQQFQHGRGLQPNGQLTQPTVDGMGLAPDSLAYR